MSQARGPTACALLVVLSPWLGCVTSPVTPVPGRRAPLPLEVDVKMLPDARGHVGGLSLRYCAQGPWPHHLLPENRRALPFLVSAVDDDGRPLPVDAEGVKTRELRGCARLVVDVGRMADALDDKDLALRTGDDLIVTPDLWLWRAAPDARAQPELLLQLDAAPYNALVPWKHAEHGRWVVDAATWTLKSDAVFGLFDVEVIDAAGARFRVARLDDGRAPPQLAAWIAAAAGAVASVSGRYPMGDVNILVVPTHVTRPIVVGFFSRGGGPTATFFVGEGAPDIRDDDLDATGRWAMTHELGHALLPAVQSPDAWFNEGLTTWYQDVLARRAGLLPHDEDYWRELIRGLDTGRARAAEDKLLLQDASARMHETAAYQHAYWAGVAVAFLAEVEAQKQGASLDDLVRALRGRFKDDRPHSAAELLAAITEGKAGVAARALEAAWTAHRAEPFPDVAATLAALGVRVDALGAIHFDDTAPLAALRRRITLPDAR